MGFVETYHYILNNQSDPRVADWPLMSSPWLSYLLTLLYLLIVWKGPALMKNRPAFELRYILIFYNFGLVVLSTYMFWELLATSILQPGFSWTCQAVDYSKRPEAIRLAKVCWWYFFSKIIEFWDTFFFILRKKNNQVSFLHVYHHSTMVFLWWIGVKYVAGGESYFSALLNSFVHILMYTYYMLTAVGPHMQKYLWWKRYMTSIQLGQFVMILIHTIIAMLTQCGYPQPYGYALVLYMFSHIALFSNFYHKSYIVKKKDSQTNGHGPVKAD